MNAARSSKPNLVLGGTGKTVRRIVERLERPGVPTRGGSRSAKPSFDREDRTTWPGALEGTSAVYVSCILDFAEYAKETAATGVWESPA